MAPVTVTTEIAHSALDVFAYATDPTRRHEWQSGVVDGHMATNGIPRWATGA